MGRRALAAAAVAVGLVVAPAGLAIGVPHVRVTGWTFEAIAGLVLAVVGLVLLVGGAAVLVRSLRRWWRLLGLPVAVVLLYAIAYPIAIAVFATNVPRPALGRATPADRGLAYTDASFVTSDGARLSGWYVPSRNRAAVVVLHGASSTRTAVLDQAVVLAHHGYGVLLFDARGMGRSGGRAMDLGWQGDRDVAAALAFLRRRPDVDPTRLAALGESMGGEEAVGAMAASPQIRAVVAEGATGRVAGDQSWLADRYGVQGRVQLGVNWLKYALVDLLSDAPPPITLRAAVARAAPRPVLLIAAGRVADEGEAARAVQRASPRTVERWVVPGAGHCGGLRARPADWERRVVAFLDAALDVRSPSGRS